MEAIDAYLFGGTVFRYATIFGTGFSTTAFVEALAAGARNESFPLRGILLATREKYPSLKRARRQVAALESDTDDSWGGPTTAGGQQRSPATEYRPRHPLDHERPLDIDHIYASALASRMHEASNWRKHHPERWWVNTIGNMWLLDAGTNRALRDQKPQVKFGRLEDWLLATPMTHQVWPTAQWSMTDSEIRRFIEVDTGLDHNINRAMKKFARLVEARADRLLDAPFGMLPDARLFARDAALEPRDDWRPTDGALSKELAERLKLTNVLGRLEEASPPQHSREPVPYPKRQRSPYRRRRGCSRCSRMLTLSDNGGSWRSCSRPALILVSTLARTLSASCSPQRRIRRGRSSQSRPIWAASRSGCRRTPSRSSSRRSRPTTRNASSDQPTRSVCLTRPPSESSSQGWTAYFT
jgi:hypothetical protein